MTFKASLKTAPNEGRNVFSYRGLKMKAIEDFTVFDGFSCCGPNDDKDIDGFIHNDARRHFKDKVAVTYGLFLEDAPGKAARFPLGFATLQNDAIKMDGTKYPYENMPAVKIGRFGIRREVHREGFGALFLTMIRLFMSQPDNRTGCRYLTLNTYPALVRFYEKNNFTALGGKRARLAPTEQLIMYLDLTASSIHR